MNSNNNSQVIEPLKPLLNKFKHDLISGIANNIRTEMDLLQIEFNSASIPNKKMHEITKKVKTVKSDMWAKALKESQGDEKKAYKIYSKISL